MGSSPPSGPELLSPVLTISFPDSTSPHSHPTCPVFPEFPKPPPLAVPSNPDRSHRPPYTIPSPLNPFLIELRNPVKGIFTPRNKNKALVSQVDWTICCHYVRRRRVFYIYPRYPASPRTGSHQGTRSNWDLVRRPCFNPRFNHRDFPIR